MEKKIEIAERLRHAINNIGIRGVDLASDMGITTAASSQIMTGKVGLSGPVLKLLSILYNLNPDWLLHGEGEMFLSAKIGGMVEDHPSEAREAGTKGGIPPSAPTTVGEQKSRASTLGNPADEPIPNQDKRLQDCVTKWVYLSEPHKATLHELFGFYYERDRKNKDRATPPTLNIG